MNWDHGCKWVEWFSFAECLGTPWAVKTTGPWHDMFLQTERTIEMVQVVESMSVFQTCPAERTPWQSVNTIQGWHYHILPTSLGKTWDAHGKHRATFSHLGRRHQLSTPVVYIFWRPYLCTLSYEGRVPTIFRLTTFMDKWTIHRPLEHIIVCVTYPFST